MTGVALMSSIIEGRKVEIDENVPHFSVVNTKENPFKPMTTGNKKQLYNP